MKKTRDKNKKNSVVYLYQWRSVMAFVACFADLLLSFLAIISSVIINTKASAEYETFHYYTNISNCYNAFIACMIIPFAVEGIKKKRFVYPRWLAVMHYSGTYCITITMVFAVCFISWYDTKLAFGTITNCFLHVVCPSLLILSFFLSECGYRFTKKETLISMIPFLIYAGVYLVNVVFLKRWRDLYQLTTLLPWPVSLVLIILFAVIIGFILVYFYHKFSRKRQKSLTDRWRENYTSEQINHNVYELGVLNGKASDPALIPMNLDVQILISEYFDQQLEELTDSYKKGAIEGNAERASENRSDPAE